MNKIIFLLVFCLLFGCSGSVTKVIPPEKRGTLSPANIPNQKETEEPLFSTPQDTGQDRQKTAEFFKTEISNKATKPATENPQSENDNYLNECKPNYIQGNFSPDENWYVCQTPYDFYLKNVDSKEVVFEPPGITKNDKTYWFSPIRWSRDGRFIWVGAGETGGFAEYCDPAQPLLGTFQDRYDNRNDFSDTSSFKK